MGMIIMVEWFTLQLHKQEVPGLILSLQAGHFDQHMKLNTYLHSALRLRILELYLYSRNMSS